jgi:hypothetical protein
MSKKLGMSFAYPQTRGAGSGQQYVVIASEVRTRQSVFAVCQCMRLPRRFTPRNDGYVVGIKSLKADSPQRLRGTEFL